MKTTLNIEESARLIELGVDAKLASSYYTMHRIPVFNIIDILSILPKEIEQVDRHPMTVVYYWSSTNKAWIAYYDYVEETIMASAPELIDSLYQLLIWCLEQGHCKCGKGGGK